MSLMDCDKCGGRGYIYKNFTRYTTPPGGGSDYYDDSTTIPHDGYIEIENIVCPKCRGYGKIEFSGADGSKRESCVERSWNDRLDIR
jgi:RecJ-like exonuclease